MGNNPVTILALLLGVSFAMSVIAEPVASCAMSSLKDRTDIRGDVRIAYSPLDCNGGSVLVDGEELVSFDVAGAVDWNPPSAGFHAITHIAGTNEWTLPLIVPATAVMSSLKDRTDILGDVRIAYSPLGCDGGSVLVDGEELVSFGTAGTVDWKPSSAGFHSITHIAGTNEWTLPLIVPATAVMSSLSNETEVAGSMRIDYSPLDVGSVSVSVDGVVLVSAKQAGHFYWMPQTTGLHTLACTVGSNVWEQLVRVTSVNKDVEPVPDPPMEVVDSITISPEESKVYPMSGGGGVIRTFGESGEWTAAVSADWITLTATNGAAGDRITYTVGVNSSVVERKGYVYVAGRVFTVRQSGTGGVSISSSSAEVDWRGANGTIVVSVPDGAQWNVYSDVDWLGVSALSGVGSGEVVWTAAPWNEHSVRSGTLTIAGETFIVTQYGRTVWLDSYSAEHDATAGEIKITVNTLNSATWSVTSNVDWIEVTDAGSGEGDGEVTITLAENQTFELRGGSVQIGDEIFTVTQHARLPEVEPFDVQFAAAGGVVVVHVNAAVDTQWSVGELSSWLSASQTEFTGTGDFVLTAGANLTLIERTADIVIAGQAFMVRQFASSIVVKCDNTVFDAWGDMGTVEVVVPDGVSWQAVTTDDWIILGDGKSHVGGDTIAFFIDYCEVEEGERKGAITIGDKKIVISQRAGMTLTTVAPVPYSWISQYFPDTTDYESVAHSIAANGMSTVEEAYVAGLDPSNPKDKFIAKIEMVGGKSVVTWTPDLNEGGTKSVRTYKTWGKD